MSKQELQLSIVVENLVWTKSFSTVNVIYSAVAVPSAVAWAVDMCATFLVRMCVKAKKGQTLCRGSPQWLSTLNSLLMIAMKFTTDWRPTCRRWGIQAEIQQAILLLQRGGSQLVSQSRTHHICVLPPYKLQYFLFTFWLIQPEQHAWVCMQSPRAPLSAP